MCLAFLANIITRPSKSYHMRRHNVNRIIKKKYDRHRHVNELEASSLRVFSFFNACDARCLGDLPPRACGGTGRIPETSAISIKECRTRLQKKRVLAGRDKRFF